MKFARFFTVLFIVLNLVGPSVGSGSSHRFHHSASHQKFNFQNVARVIAVGDIHGDYDGLLDILRSSSLIGERREWIGERAHLVLMGDLIAGKPGSKHILDLVISLQRQAEQAGGHVHALLGNHDLLVAAGDYSRMKKEERKAFLPFEGMSKREEKAWLDDLFLYEGSYAKFFASRPITLVINDQVYVHAGLDEQALDYSIEELNQLTHAWIRYFQTGHDRPDKRTQWVVGMKKEQFQHDIGPAFTRDFKVTKSVARSPDKRPKGAIKRKKLDKVLSHFGAKQMVIGHVPTPESDIHLEHPFYGSRVVSLDTRISNSIYGKLSAIEVHGRDKPKAVYTQRRLETVSRQPIRCEVLFGSGRS